MQGLNPQIELLWASRSLQSQCCSPAVMWDSSGWEHFPECIKEENGENQGRLFSAINRSSSFRLSFCLIIHAEKSCPLSRAAILSNAGIGPQVSIYKQKMQTPFQAVRQVAAPGTTQCSSLDEMALAQL